MQANTPSKIFPELIESSESMENLMKRLDNCELIAVDTEFFRETTYFPELALVQIATYKTVACIDPLAFDAKPYLKKLLIELPLTKIFHSCSQDLEVLYYYLGVIPTTIYDTQIANALLTDNHQIGYASLVENELNIQLEKSQTRTNWLQRPLTNKQIQYAGDDVLYLFQLHRTLEKKLNESNRKTWFSEESARIASTKNDFQIDNKKLWKRVKGATKLKRKQLAIVQSIAVWREELAQKKNITRKKFLADDLIIQLALTPPDNIESLDKSLIKKSPNNKPNTKKSNNTDNYNQHEKQQLLETITTAKNTPPESWPDTRFNALDQQQKVLLKKLQHLVNTKAEELGISGSVLSSKKELEKLILQNDNKNSIAVNNAENITNKHTLLQSRQQQNLLITQGWRYHCIGKKLLETLN